MSASGARCIQNGVVARDQRCRKQNECMEVNTDCYFAVNIPLQDVCGVFSDYQATCNFAHSQNLRVNLIGNPSRKVLTCGKITPGMVIRDSYRESQEWLALCKN